MKKYNFKYSLIKKKEFFSVPYQLTIKAHWQQSFKISNENWITLSYYHWKKISSEKMSINNIFNIIKKKLWNNYKGERDN
jgi:hypothetical protein